MRTTDDRGSEAPSAKMQDPRMGVVWYKAVIKRVIYTLLYGFYFKVKTPNKCNIKRIYRINTPSPPASPVAPAALPSADHVSILKHSKRQ